jgi:ATP-dependent DNA helicase RecQ
MDSYGILKLNDASAKALKGEQEIFLREDILPAKSKEKLTKLKSKSKSGVADSKDDLAVDEQLFNKLKALRLSLAKEHKLAPYMVFHDTTLKEMAASKPQNLDEMSSITGVGQAKLKKYGEAFLALTS